MSAAPEEGVSADTLARAAAQSSFERPMLLVAGAGTGKTTALVARVASWCVGAGWERAEQRLENPFEPQGPDRERIAADVLARVVAITFTEAAAAEMSLRVGSAFSELAAGQQPVGLQPEASLAGSARVRARALLGSLDHLRVSTIHSFCRSLLARHPLEAGLHPRFEVDADERQQTEVIREVLQRALRDADAAPTRTPLFQLLAEGFGLSSVEEVLIALLREGVSVSTFSANPLSRERVDASLEALSESAARLWETVLGPLGDDGVAASTFSLLEALSFTLDAIHPKLAIDSDALCEFVDELAAAWEGSARNRLSKWTKTDFLVGEAERLGAQQGDVAKLASELLPLLVPFLELHPRRLELARQAIAPLLDQCWQALRERGAIGYTSLLLGARDLLESNPELRAVVRSGIDQLLVDEFQDTDRVQCEIIRWLALEGPPEARPGLFLVGDPKQSIYGWRSADLRAYDDFAREISEQGGETHLLNVNFRSAPAILDEVQRVVEPVMSRKLGVQPAFESLSACADRENDPGFCGDQFAPVEHWVSWKWDAEASAAADKTRAAEATELEARALALNIRSLHDQQGVAWRDVAVLFRAMSDLDEYLAALRECGVPYAVERDRSYYQRREVVDAAALVRCVLDPNDGIALVALLRSPAVGVPDAALIPLWTAELPRLVADLASGESAGLEPLTQVIRDTASDLAARAHELPGIEEVAGWHETTIAAIENLGALRESFESDPADVFVERLRALQLGEVAEASRHLGAFRAANLERFFRELLEDLASGVSCAQMLRRLRGDGSSASDARDQGPKTHELDAVRVMTIHKAKGLDFEHVYVMQLHKAAGNRGRPQVEVHPEPGALEMRMFGTATLGLESLRARRAEVEAAERVRALYVAMTRAKRRIVLAGSWRGSSEEIAPELAAAPVDLLRSRRALPGDDWADQSAPDFANWMGHEQRGGRCWRDGLSARWVFPALISEEPPTCESELPAADLPDEAALRRGSQQLAMRRREAQIRMSRPWRAAASAHATEATHSPLPAHEHANAAEAAAAAGTAVHRLLEEIDLEAAAALGLERARKRLPSLLAGTCPVALRSETLQRAEELLLRFQTGPLCERFDEIRPCVVARELPVILLPPESDTSPVGAVSGQIDLVYREPGSGRLVVVDYKTDRVEASDALIERADGYRVQAQAYVHALAQALQPELRPRCELWFLHPGRIVPLSL